MKPGTIVRIKGLVKAAKHNGKVGKISATAAPEGRLAVKLDDGTTLAVRRANVDKIDGEVGGSVMDSAKQRTLTRDNSMLHEFNGNPDPNVLALYYHYGDRAFDCFNATEYNTQMLRYYAADIVVVLVVPRKIGQNDHFLVGLHHKIPENNTLCEVAFNCGRSFAGISMLVKKRCFVCNRPGAPMCKCKCACFCTTCKTNSGYALHEKVCKSIQASTITVEEESVQL